MGSAAVVVSVAIVDSHDVGVQFADPSLTTTYLLLEAAAILPAANSFADVIAVLKVALERRVICSPHSHHVGGDHGHEVGHDGLREDLLSGRSVDVVDKLEESLALHVLRVE